MANVIFKTIRRAVFGLPTEERITCSTSSPHGSTHAEPGVYMDNPFASDMPFTEMPLEPAILQRDSQAIKENLLESTSKHKRLWLNYGKRISGSTGPLSEQRPFRPLNMSAGISDDVSPQQLT